MLTDVSISGFSSENDLVSLDAVNGFQLTVDGTTYKTSGAGANVRAITGTGTNGGILLKDIVTWIQGISAERDLNLLPRVLQNGGIATFVLAQQVEKASAISIAGIGASSAYPELISSTQTQGDETARFAFSNLKQGDSLTIAGLTMVAKQDLTSSQAATAFNTMRDGVTTNVVSSINNGSRSDPKTGKATIEISDVQLPTSAGTYKLTSLNGVLTMTKYVDSVASTTASIRINTNFSDNPASNPPTVRFQEQLNGQTVLNFGELGSFKVNTILASSSFETAAEIASKILNAIDSAGQITANQWVSIPDANWVSDALTNLSNPSPPSTMKVVITTTGSTKIRLADYAAGSVQPVTGYIPVAQMDDGLVEEMAFTGNATVLSEALKTLEAFSPDGLGKVSVHIVPTDISVRVDSVTGAISYYKRTSAQTTWANALVLAKSDANKLVTSGDDLTGYLSNLTSAEETTYLINKLPMTVNTWIGATDVITEGRWVWTNGPEAGLEFHVARQAVGGANTSITNATASTSVVAGSSTQAEVRAWSLSGAAAITLYAGKTIGFKLIDPSNPSIIDTVYYTNTSATSQGISAVLANLKSYFDSNSVIDVPTNGIYSIDGTKNSASAGALGLFSQFNFTYAVAANNLTGSFAFTGKNPAAITDGSQGSFQVSGIDLYSFWNTGGGEPNDSGGNEDYVQLRLGVYNWNDSVSTAGNPRQYLIEYNAPSNSTLLRREISIPSPGVITISGNADPAAISALNYANFTGSVSGYTTSLSGSQLTFTSTQPATNINPNISYAFTPAAGSPTVFAAPVVTDGGNGALANASLQFPPGGLNAGDSVTVSGLRFTAGRAITAGEVASAFASLANGAITGAGSSYGSYSGALTGFSSGAAVNSNQLVFTQIVSGTQTSIEKSSSITKASTGTGLTVDKFSTAQNAIFTVGDTSYSKTSNTIGDAITGVTLSLMEEGVAKVLVALGEDKSETTIKGFMTAYNDLIKSTNSMTANSSNSTKPGAFANSPTNLAFISEIKRKVAEGGSYNIPKAGASGQPARFSLASLGLEYQLDGTLAFNSVSLLTAQSTGLRDKLLSGLKVGYQSSTDNLANLLDSQISSISSLAYQTSESTQSVKSLNKEKDQIKARLDKIQAGYIVQYANLNKLLFQLNSTSTSLESALDGLTDMNSKK